MTSKVDINGLAGVFKFLRPCYRQIKLIGWTKPISCRTKPICCTKNGSEDKAFRDMTFWFETYQRHNISGPKPSGRQNLSADKTYRLDKTYQLDETYSGQNLSADKTYLLYKTCPEPTYSIPT